MKSACKNRFLATFLLAICFIMGTPLWAQQKVVHGVVEDLEGNPMPGVSVMVPDGDCFRQSAGPHRSG